MFRSRVPEPMPRTPSVAATATPSPPPSALGAAEEAPGPAHSNKEIDGAVRAAVAQVLGSHPFAVDLVDEWCNQILEHSIKQVASWGRPFKYIGTCVVSRQSHETLDTAATAFWDTQSDSMCCTRCGNGHVDCIVTIYACRR
mmetsp:Transcript_22721/g.59252  ORF Transcript_22721/g.59252 Transcript_22721/m.59252 type:complete len:142 (-) Transcript_22721:48-473(-)